MSETSLGTARIGLSVDETGAIEGVTRVGRKIDELGGKAGKAGAQASEGIGAIGEAGQQAGVQMDKASERIAKDLRRIENEAIRTYASMKALNEGTGQYGALLNKGLARGLSREQLEPVLAGLKEFEKNTARGALSARELSFSLRSLPAQFTDIAVSLQGGQQPLTVLLQQGGQLKDMFGGVGNAARAMGGYIAGLVNVYSVSAVAIAGLAVAYEKGRAESEAFAKSLILTGNAAGTSVSGLNDLAVAVAAVSGATQGKAAEALNALAATGKVVESSMSGAAAAAIAFEKTAGVSIEESVKQFAELGKSPVEASLKLNEAANYLTASIYAQIKALDDQGRSTEAAAVAQKAYADAMLDRSAEIEVTLGTLEKGWRAIIGTAKQAWDAMLNVGREDGLAEQLAEVESKIAKADGYLLSRYGKEWNAQADLLRSLLGLQEQRNAQQREYVEGESAAIKFMKEGEQYLSKKAKMEREVAAARTLAVKAGYDEAVIQERIAAIKKKYEEKPDAAANAFKTAAKAAAEYAAELAAAAAQGEKLSKGEKALADAENKLTAAQFKRLKGQLEANIEAEKQIELHEDLAKSIKETGKAIAESALAGVAAFAPYSASLEEQIAKVKEETAALTLSEAAMREFTVQLAMQKSGLDATNPKLKEYADSLRDALSARDAGKAAKKAAEESAREWKRFTDDLERGLTDALMRSFEAGESFGTAFVKNLRNLLKTAALKVVVQAIVDPITGALKGGGSSGGTGGISMIGNGLSAVGTFTGSAALAEFGQGMAGTFVGPMQAGSAASIGSSVATAAPYVAAAYAAYKLAEASGVFGHAGTPHTGGMAQYSAATGLQTGRDASGLTYDFNLNNFDANLTNSAANLAKGITTMLDTTAQAFGQATGFAVGTGFADDSSKDGSWGALQISRGGSSLIDWKRGADNWPGREFADGSAGQEQYNAAVAADVRRVLDEMDLPAWADSMLSQLGNTPSLDNLTTMIDQINGFAGALGSIDTIFMSDTERLDAAFQKLQLSVPETKDDYIALAKAQDLTTAAGRANYLALLDLAPAWQQLNQDVADTTTTMRSAADIASEQARLQEEYNGLTMTSTQLRAEERKVIDESNQALFDSITKLREKADAEAAAAKAKADADQKAAAIANERTGIETALLQLQGNTAKLRERELAALDETNRSLQQQIYDLTDAKAAQDAYARAAQETARKLTEAQAAVTSAMNAVANARNAVEAVQGQGTSAYLTALANVEAAQQRIADLQLDAQVELARAANDAARQMADLAKQLREFVDGAAGSPSSNFSRLLTKALAGDKEAMQALPGAASGAIDAAGASASTAQDFARQRAAILAQVSSVAALAEIAGGNTMTTPAGKDALAEAQANLTASQTALAEALRVANAIGAPLTATVTDLIGKYATAQADLTTAVADLAKAQATLDAIKNNTAATTVNTAAMAVAVDGVKTAILVGVVDEFAKLDASLDGLLTFDEFKTGFVGLASEETLKSLFDLTDVNSDGFISAIEAADASIKSILPLFDKLDTSLDGLLTFEEYKVAFAGLATDAQLKAGFDKLDTNNDGMLSKLEAIKTASETTAAKDLSVTVNANNTSSPVFAADDPLRSVFAAIQEGTRWMLQLASGQQIGSNNSIDYDSLNSWFDGSVKTNIESRNYLASIDAMTTRADAWLSGIYNDINATKAIVQNINLVTTDFQQNGLLVKFDRGTAEGFAGGDVFASGGAFTNGIVRRPTSFNIGTMGEAGSEAIMPLANLGGRLGVQAATDPAVRKLLSELIDEVQNLRAEAKATARSTAKTAQSLDSVITGGETMKTEAA
jgi:phage-related minor tail protein